MPSEAGFFVQVCAYANKCQKKTLEHGEKNAGHTIILKGYHCSTDMYTFYPGIHYEPSQIDHIDENKLFLTASGKTDPGQQEEVSYRNS